MKRKGIAPKIVLCVPLIAMFGMALVSSQTFIFRDSGHFYHPLFQWIDSEWRAGRVPLWNPLENTGLPVVADASSSVFYPGKLIFFLPLGYDLCYKLYVVGHVLLAAVATYWVARRWRASVWGATLAGITYAYGGNVVFQHSNVVFLVGAAWLPFALLAGERMLAQRSVSWALQFGAVLALMVLGGDPQMGYNAGLAAASYALVLWRSERRAAQNDPATKASPLTPRPSPSRGEGSQRYGWSVAQVSRSRAGLLAIAAATGVLLAAIQIVPAWQWAAHSRRAEEEKPITIYSAARANWNEGRSGFFGSPEAGTHHRHIYEFSVGPWRLIEYVWPNVTGRMFPKHQRWIDIVPTEDRVWSPSNYLGLLPLVCAVAAIRWRRGLVRQRWLAWLTIGAILGSMGWFGLGWWLDEVRFWFTQDSAKANVLGQPVGGLYWLMVTFLPGYAYFRYPAKLMVVAALGISLLAARGLDSLLIRPPSWLGRALATFGIFNFAAATVMLLIRPQWKSASPNDWYGPLDAAGAMFDIVFAFAQTGILCFVLRAFLCGVTKPTRAVFAAWLTAVTAVDITVANTWMIPTGPNAVFYRPKEFSNLIWFDATNPRGSSPVGQQSRVYGAKDLETPHAWRTQASSQRPLEQFSWEREVLFPKHHLAKRLGAVETLSSLESHDYAAFMEACRRHFRTPDDRPDAQAIAAWFSAGYLLTNSDTPPPNKASVLNKEKLGWGQSVTLWKNDQPLPRAWIVHQVVELPRTNGDSAKEISRRWEDSLFPGGNARDLLKEAVVETDEPLRIAPRNLKALLRNDEPLESCTIESNEPQRIEIAVQLSSPGLLLVNDFYFRGWRAYLKNDDDSSPREVPILRTNWIMRGVALPAGEHRIIFRYQPTSFYVGAAVSGLAWVVLVVSSWLVTRRKSGPS